MCEQAFDKEKVNEKREQLRPILYFEKKDKASHLAVEETQTRKRREKK